MLADSATELAAAQALTYKVAADIESGIDVKVAHGRASMAKLYASEMVGRVTDRCVQISAAAATCARTRSSGCPATTGSTGSGKVPARCSA